MSRGQCQGQNPAALSPSLATHSCWLFANLQMPRRLSLVTPDVGQTASPSPRKHGDLSGPLLSAPVSPPSPAHRVLLQRGGPALARRNAAGVVGKEGLRLSWWGAPAGIRGQASGTESSPPRREPRQAFAVDTGLNAPGTNSGEPYSESSLELWFL